MAIVSIKIYYIFLAYKPVSQVFSSFVSQGQIIVPFFIDSGVISKGPIIYLVLKNLIYVSVF